MNYDTIITLFGGIGMFLLGMHLMTDGLKMAAGKALRHILEHSTKTPIRAVFSGVLITSLVQSSSAVTVATIGFVNAGLLKLGQAVRVIYGSNVGTTMTGWLVALLGFHINIQAMALPAIGVGMFLKLFAKNERHSALGLAFTGFGVLFLGIDFLKSAFTGIESSFDLAALAGTGLMNELLFLGTGFVMTLLMQSSSAAMALTLTAAGSGWIPIEAAAAMVIGTNLGTTSTAMLAAIGATPNAKRVAASHVIFNLITGAVALLTLPLWLWCISYLGVWLDGGSSHVATMLALFHTLFNLLGVLLMWPLTARMVVYLETLFHRAEDDESNPRHLDLTLVDTPELAHVALGKELQRVAVLVGGMSADAISTEASVSMRLRKDLYIVMKLADAIGGFIVRLRQVALPEYLSPSFSHALTAIRYFVEVADLSRNVDEQQSEGPPALTPNIQAALSDYRKFVVLSLCIDNDKHLLFEAEHREAYLLELDAKYEALKMMLMHAGTAGDIAVRHVVNTVELVKDTRRMAKQMLKGLVALQSFTTISTVESKAEGQDEESVKVVKSDAGTDEATVIEDKVL
ncbi:MAG: hypothetical protein AUK35_09895 [Zetaproteobacteria bacterium CG2_30_46_52]|nr:MAG: hypothetical protein AUK35_09895 [Zetaproteobacteria bacterium CG2_30_46_52]